MRGGGVDSVIVFPFVGMRTGFSTFAALLCCDCELIHLRMSLVEYQVTTCCLEHMEIYKLCLPHMETSTKSSG